MVEALLRSFWVVNWTKASSSGSRVEFVESLAAISLAAYQKVTKVQPRHRSAGSDFVALRNGHQLEIWSCSLSPNALSLLELNSHEMPGGGAFT